MEGWIKLSRKLLDWEYFNDDVMLKGWMYLLLKANNEDKEWRGVEVKRGQLITTLATIAKDLRMSVQQARRMLTNLQNTCEITRKTTNKFTIITICKFGFYQDSKKSRQQALQQADEQALQQALQQQLNNIIINNKKNIPSKDGLSSEKSADPNLKEEKIDFVGLLNFWNKTMESADALIPKIKSLSERRKGNIKARVREHGKRAVFEVITKAGASDFLNGKNKNGWVADFDWTFRPNNFPKVLEGNYDNRNNHYQPQINGTSKFTDPRQAERDNLARGLAATIARRFAEDDARQAEVRQP